jgi:hypothetical protein
MRLRISRTSRKLSHLITVRLTLTTYYSTFFPSTETEDEATKELETSTEPSEILSQLPDAPTGDPKDISDVQEPSTKKQKTDDTDDDFVVVEKEDAKEDESKAEL